MINLRKTTSPTQLTLKSVVNRSFTVEAMNTSVSILTEIPEALHESLQGYLDTHPDWDQDRVLTAALSLFLLQNGTSDTSEALQSCRQAARLYLESLFQSGDTIPL